MIISIDLARKIDRRLYYIESKSSAIRYKGKYKLKNVVNVTELLFFVIIVIF